MDKLKPVYKYDVKCERCGFEYDVLTSDTSKRFLKELSDCPCGNRNAGIVKTEVKRAGETNDR